MEMVLYKKMYAKLCVAASEAIDLLSTDGGAMRAKTLLENALLEAEEIYVGWGEKEGSPGTSGE